MKIVQYTKDPDSASLRHGGQGVFLGKNDSAAQEALSMAGAFIVTDGERGNILRIILE